MAKDNTALILLIAGAAGAGIYIAMQKQKEAGAAAAIARNQGIPTEPPSLLAAFYGKVESGVSAFLEKGKLLDALIKARGTAHYAEWKAAVKAGRDFYVVKDPSGAAQCFASATGAKAPMASCPSHLIAAAELEGYF
jgi:hypothetical protein